MASPSKVFCIAGEPSGDMHQANLILALKEEWTQSEFKGIGGEKSVSAGLQLYKHFSEVAFMGVFEVLKNLKTINRVLKETKEEISFFSPDLLILTDFSGFNLRIAAFAKTKGLKVFYYIAPKVWAWNQSRVKKFPQLIDHLFCILPFEEEFFKKHGVQASFIGNPVVEVIEEFKLANKEEPLKTDLKTNLPTSLPIIAVLPGSRVQEVKANLKIMASVRKQFPEYRWVVAAVPFLPSELYDELCKKYDLEKVTDKTYLLLSQAFAAVVCSGTATLETGLFFVPQVVGYRTSFLTALVAKIVLKIPYVSLINLVAGKEVVKELLQYDFNQNNLAKELKNLLEGKQREEMVSNYKAISLQLGLEKASKKCAKKMVDIYKNPI